MNIIYAMVRDGTHPRHGVSPLAPFTQTHTQIKLYNGASPLAPFS
jgi:hypothetical protein